MEPFETDFYNVISQSWPTSGKIILGTYSDNGIVLYQAYNPTIASWAVTHKTFAGCPEFSMDRMSWVKTNFLWMMYRSGWATKSNQERILAITIKISGFEEILANASTRPPRPRSDEDGIATPTPESEDDVRLQWDPDHDPYGDKMERRAIQLGLRREILKKFVNEWILDIHDITEFVQNQYQYVQCKDLSMLKVPMEKVFVVKNEALRNCIGSDQ